MQQIAVPIIKHDRRGLGVGEIGYVVHDHREQRAEFQRGIDHEAGLHQTVQAMNLALIIGEQVWLSGHVTLAFGGLRHPLKWD